MTDISVVINTLNEESHIGPCIDSVRGFANEILLCDMYSDDKTVEIAKDLGAKVIYHERTGFVEPARYFAISQASGEWVLVIDADERLDEKLSVRLKEVANSCELDLVMFGILYDYFGDFVYHGGFYKTDFPRFFRKHKYLETYQSSDAIAHRNFLAIKNSNARRIELGPEYHLFHYAYPTIEKYVSKTLGMYAKIEAERLFHEKRSFSLIRLLGEPIKVFVGRFLFRVGFLDGTRGLILAVLYAGFRFSIWANLWLLERSGSASQARYRSK